MSEPSTKSVTADENIDETNTTFGGGNSEVNECSIAVPIKRNKRPGKVEFVRFDSKETVYTDQDEIRAKIKDEINR